VEEPPGPVVPTEMRVAAIQLNSNADKARNLESAERLVREAADAGAELVVLPEKWNLLAPGPELVEGAEPLDGPTLTAVRGWARELGIAICAGSIAERSDDPGHSFNTSVLISPEGEDLGIYRKIHLFDVDVEGVAYRESDHERPGSDVVVAGPVGDDGLSVGMSVCYDVRFPELYRALALGGADVVTVPAAFTVPTGRAHWKVLQRARAIENQVFVIAPNQVGEAPPHYDSWGHSIVVGPSGKVLASGDGSEAQVVVADLDPAERERVREAMPLLSHRRPETYD
jgi:deaminated glutathione amidase